MVSRRIEGAQKKVEERNFDIRKNLLEYDEVMDEQRKRVYSFRQSLLDGAPPKEMILEMVDKQIEDAAEPIPGRRLRRSHLRRSGRSSARSRADRARHQRRQLRRRRGNRQVQGRATARRHDPPGHRRESAPRRRAVGMDLAGPGKLGQQAVRPESQRERTAQDRHHRRRRVPLRPRRPRGVPDRESRRMRSATSTCQTPPSSFSPTGAGARSPAGSITSSRS